MAFPSPSGIATAFLALAPATFVLPASASTAVAQGGSSSGTAPDGSNQTVSFDVKDRELTAVIDFIRARTDVNIVVAPEIQEKVTLALKDVEWRKALDLVAERAGCVVLQSAANLLRVEKPPRVHFAFQNVDITVVIDAIAKLANANIVVSPEVKGPITIRLKDVPWRDALEAATKNLGFAIVEEERGILRVIARERLEDQFEMRAFNLRYVRPSSVYQPKIETFYTVGGPRVTQDVVKDFRLIDALKKVLSKNGKLDYIDRTNTIVVTDIPPVVRDIEKIIALIDVEPRQIFFDVKFVSTTRTDVFDFGVDYGAQGPVISASGGQVPIELPFKLGKGGFEDDFIVTNTPNTGPFPYSDTIATNPLSNVGATAVPSTIFGALSFTQVTAALHMLKRDVHSEIVQAPKLIVLDNHTGTIFVGEQVPYAQSSASSNQSGGLEFAIEEADKSPVSTGFQLLVTPHVVPSTDRVVLEMIPKQQSLSGSAGPPVAPAGFEVFTVGSGSTGGTIALPRIASSTIATTMILESGQTAVIGGLNTDSQGETVNKVPLLGDIPLLGWLFKRTESFKDRRALVVMVTPTIVKSSIETEDAIQHELDARQKQIQKDVERLFGGGEPKVGMLELTPPAPTPAGPPPASTESTGR